MSQEIDGAAVFCPIDDIPSTPKVLLPGHTQTPCQLTQTAQQLRPRRLGCKGAKKILAINSDAEAPILASADYAVIGDLAEIVPAITAELRKAQSS